MNVLPVPHSPTILAALALRRYFATAMTTTVWAGSSVRLSNPNSGETGSAGLCSGRNVVRIRSDSSVE